MTAITNHRLYTLQFGILCASNALFAASFNMIIPELPAYLSSLGGEDYKGLIIGLFTLTAGLSRPFSGKLTDTIGRIPIMIIGTLVCVICSLFYPILSSVSGFLLLRFLHGFSTGFTPTAVSAYVADIVPVQRRGEAMGILSVFMNAGASASPPLGSHLVNNYSLDMMFYVSSGLALLALVILLGMKETLKEKQGFHARLLLVKRNEIIDKAALPAGITMFFVIFGFGAVLTVIPDQSDYLGLSNKGLFFTSYTASSLLSRIVAGKASDRFGRVPVLKIATVMLAISLWNIGQSDSSTDILISSGLMGFAMGTASPTLFAWAVDLSHPQRRGRALATLFIALEASIGLGAVSSAYLYDNSPDQFSFTFNIMAIFCFLGFCYLQFLYTYREARRDEPEMG